MHRRSMPNLQLSLLRRGFLSKALGLLAVLGMVAAQVNQGVGGESSLAEYKVKALFLFNFAKYVEWPPEAFASADSPIVIGIIGENRFGNHLAKAVEGKSISGRSIVVRQIDKEEALLSCQILFISGSEKARLPQILDLVKTRPILTVSEIENFTQRGGAIGFVKKEERIRLEIDLEAAQRARLQLSSKLLSVADSVRGKP